MRKSKRIKKISCVHHRGHYHLLTDDEFIWCKKCRKECNRLTKEKTKELRAYIDKRFMEIGKKLEGGTE